MEQKKRLGKAAGKLVDLIEGHWGQRSPLEHEARSRAFDRAVAKIGIGANPKSLRKLLGKGSVH